MSFGLKKNVSEVSDAIGLALERKKIVFAAAANEGGLEPRAYPASLPGVICIHASDGYGTPAEFNPTPESGDNFSTVGIAIDSAWKGKPVLRSGTSFATPVAAGIAANILEFARTHLTREDDNAQFLYSYRGMRHILLAMSPERSNYNFMSFWNVFPERDNPAEGLDEICKDLRKFISTEEIAKAWKGKHA